MTTQRAYYEIVRDVLTTNIRDGALPPGTRLFVAAVADRLAVSRSPVKRALELLAEDGAVWQDGSHGYVVGAPGQAAPERVNLHKLELSLPEIASATLVPPSWELILETVERDVMDAAPFGIYQISEAAICNHFGVSRTVTREVLARLHDRGTIAKDRASHWVAGPLSARMLDEIHEIRRRLEPAALEQAAQEPGGRALDRARIAPMRDRVEAALEHGRALSQAELEEIERDLHQRCLSGLRNQRLARAVRNVQVGFVVNRLFATYIGRHDDSDMLREHRLVYDHLAIGDAAGAGVALAHHLKAEHARTRERLKVLSIFGEPDIAPYLTRMV